MRTLRTLMLAVAFAACGDGPTRPGPAPGPPAAVAVFSGNAQPGTVGAPLANPVVVRVTDADGEPVPDVEVRFEPPAGGGSVRPGAVRTSRDGVASTTWTLGGTAGTQTLTAAVEGVPSVTVTAAASAAAAARLHIQADSIGFNGLQMVADVTARFLDPFGNPAATPAGASIAWSSLEPAVSTVEGGPAPGAARVTSRGVGRGRVVATGASLADTLTVGVVRVPTAMGVEVPGGPLLVVAQYRDGIVVVNDAGGVRIPDPPVAWESSDTGVLTVDANGRIRGTGAGLAYVRAQSGALRSEVLVRVLPAFVASAFSAGGGTTCALTAEGRAWCWGSSYAGQVGTGRTDDMYALPQAVASPLRFATVSVGANRHPPAPRAHTCAVAAGGEAWCWGAGDYGQLGTGSIPASRCTTLSWPCSRSPVRVAGAGWSTVAAGVTHTCALTAAGAAWCWGAGDRGQLGAAGTSSCLPETAGEPSVPCALAPVAVTGGHTFSAVTAGDGYTCALTQAGAAWCWGANEHGQLGDGTTTRSAVPVQVAGGHAFTRVSAGVAHACGTTAAGDLYCWGRNQAGQLGNGGTASRSTPARVGGGGTYTAVSAGGLHTCGIRTGGAAYCWGTNFDFQLGFVLPGQSSTPLAVSDGQTFTAVSAGSDYTCGVRTGDSILMCWGAGTYGRLGINDGIFGRVAVPTSVRGPGT